MKSKKLYIFGSILLLIIAAVTLLIINYTRIGKDEVYPVSEQKVKSVAKELNVQILRYDLDVFKIHPENAVSELEVLSHKYPDFLIPQEQLKNPQAIAAFVSYLKDPVIQEINKDVQSTFLSLDDFMQQFKAAVSRYLVIFPKDSVPVIITMVPGIVMDMPSTYLYDNYLFINLDLYMGANSKYYKQVGIPNYISERMDKKYMVIDCFKKALVYKYLSETSMITVLDNMIYEGKKLYFAEVMNPEVPKADIIGYNTNKYQWAEQNYGKVWAYIVEKNHLFAKEDELIRRYTDEGPFTQPFGNSSAGRMGQFIGWKIVKEYMQRHPEVKCDEMLQDDDSQKILRESQFKPVK